MATFELVAQGSRGNGITRDELFTNMLLSR